MLSGFGAVLVVVSSLASLLSHQYEKMSIYGNFVWLILYYSDVLTSQKLSFFVILPISQHMPLDI